MYPDSFVKANDDISIDVQVGFAANEDNFLILKLFRYHHFYI